MSEQAELLAPAGDDAALQAALSAGADAVYLGLESWSARAFAPNFSAGALLEAVDRAHLFGARVHLALNTLLKDDEIEPALASLAAPYEAGLDALIVADLGFAALARGRYPDLPLHASTQLNSHSSAQLALLAELGFKRAILARELAVDEIAALDTHGLDLEVFVHGALCYGYSGLCLFSSMVGGRSGNRGRCSQACRMRYRLVAAGKEGVVAGEEGVAGDDAGVVGKVGPLERVLSTSDLAAIEALPALLAAGVTSFKIEGRMKDAGYVAVATAVYREALDEALADPQGYRVKPEWLARLGQSFSRGFTNAHLEGRHANVRSAGRGGHRGVAVGRVERVDEEQGLATLRTTEPLADGDVIVVYTPWGHTEPARVGSLRAAARPPSAGVGPLGMPPAHRTVVRLRERVTVKDRVFRLSAGELDEFTREAVAARSLARPVDLDVSIEGKAGERARLTVTVLEAGARPSPVSVESSASLEPSRTVALDNARLRDALGALGGTPYRLAELDSRLEGRVFLPVAVLKELRRKAVAELDERRLAARRRPTPAAPAAAAPLGGDRRGAVRLSATARPAPRPGEGDTLPLVLRLRAGDEPVLSSGLAAVCLDLRGGDSATRVAAAFESLAGWGVEVRCRPPEVLFDAELAWWSRIAKLPWAAVYARHAAHLVEGLRAILEYPLQGLNRLAPPLLAAGGLVASPESSLDEIASLVASCELPVEVFGFGRQQLLLSRDELGRQEGLVSLTDAARIEQELSLVDAKGFVFPVAVSRGETRLSNARVTNLAPAAAELARAGVSGFIVEQRSLSPHELEALRARGLDGLAAATARERSTTGHLFRGVS